MDDARLEAIEREVAVGRTLPGRADAFALATMTDLLAEVRRLRRVRLAAERVDAKYREEDPWIDPTQLFEELCWLGTVLVETRNGVSG